MKKIKRIVSLVLVLSLAGDPVSAAVVSTLHSPSPILHLPSSTLGLFTDQALTLHLANFWRGRNETAIHEVEALERQSSLSGASHAVATLDEDDPSHPHFTHPENFLTESRGHGPNPDEIQALIEIISNHLASESSRIVALAYLQYSALSKDQLQSLCRVVSRPGDIGVRMHAAVFLGSLRFRASSEVVSTLNTVLASVETPTDLRSTTLGVLSHKGIGADTLAILREVFRHPGDPALRVKACETLRMFSPDPQDIRMFYSAFDDLDPVVREAAFQALYYRSEEDIRRELTPQELVGKELPPVHWPPRSEKPKVAIIVLDHYQGGELSHGQEVLEHTREYLEHLGRAEQVAIYPVEEYRPDPQIDQAPWVDDVRALMAAHPDTIFIINLSVIRLLPDLVQGLIAPAIVEELGSKGAVFVTAAGNSSALPQSRSGLRVRYLRSNAVLVGAAVTGATGKRRTYSWFGPDVTYSADPGPGRSGTSYVAPAGSALLADALLVQPLRPVDESIRHLYKAATPLSDPAYLQGFLGVGLLEVPRPRPFTGHVRPERFPSHMLPPGASRELVLDALASSLEVTARLIAAGRTRSIQTLVVLAQGVNQEFETPLTPAQTEAPDQAALRVFVQCLRREVFLPADQYIDIEFLPDSGVELRRAALPHKPWTRLRYLSGEIWAQDSRWFNAHQPFTGVDFDDMALIDLRRTRAHAEAFYEDELMGPGMSGSMPEDNVLLTRLSRYLMMQGISRGEYARLLGEQRVRQATIRAAQDRLYASLTLQTPIQNVSPTDVVQTVLRSGTPLYRIHERASAREPRERARSSQIIATYAASLGGLLAEMKTFLHIDHREDLAYAAFLDFFGRVVMEANPDRRPLASALQTPNYVAMLVVDSLREMGRGLETPAVLLNHVENGLAEPVEVALSLVEALYQTNVLDDPARAAKLARPAVSADLMAKLRKPLLLGAARTLDAETVTGWLALGGPQAAADLHAAVGRFLAPFYPFLVNPSGTEAALIHTIQKWTADHPSSSGFHPDPPIGPRHHRERHHAGRAGPKHEAAMDFMGGAYNDKIAYGSGDKRSDPRAAPPPTPYTEDPHTVMAQAEARMKSKISEFLQKEGATKEATDVFSEFMSPEAFSWLSLNLYVMTHGSVVRGNSFEQQLKAALRHVIDHTLAVQAQSTSPPNPAVADERARHAAAIFGEFLGKLLLSLKDNPELAELLREDLAIDFAAYTHRTYAQGQQDLIGESRALWARYPEGTFLTELIGRSQISPSDKVLFDAQQDRKQDFLYYPMQIIPPQAKHGDVILDVGTALSGIDTIHSLPRQEGLLILSDIRPFAVRVLQETLRWSPRPDIQVMRLNGADLSSVAAAHPRLKYITATTSLQHLSEEELRRFLTAARALLLPDGALLAINTWKGGKQWAATQALMKAVPESGFRVDFQQGGEDISSPHLILYARPERSGSRPQEPIGPRLERPRHHAGWTSPFDSPAREMNGSPSTYAQVGFARGAAARRDSRAAFTPAPSLALLKEARRVAQVAQRLVDVHGIIEASRAAEMHYEGLQQLLERIRDSRVVTLRRKSVDALAAIPDRLDISRAEEAGRHGLSALIRVVEAENQVLRVVQEVREKRYLESQARDAAAAAWKKLVTAPVIPGVLAGLGLTRAEYAMVNLIYVRHYRPLRKNQDTLLAILRKYPTPGLTIAREAVETIVAARQAEDAAQKALRQVQKPLWNTGRNADQLAVKAGLASRTGLLQFFLGSQGLSITDRDLVLTQLEQYLSEKSPARLKPELCLMSAAWYLRYSGPLEMANALTPVANKQPGKPKLNLRSVKNAIPNEFFGLSTEKAERLRTAGQNVEKVFAADPLQRKLEERVLQTLAAETLPGLAQEPKREAFLRFVRRDIPLSAQLIQLAEYGRSKNISSKTFKPLPFSITGSIAQNKVFTFGIAGLTSYYVRFAEIAPHLGLITWLTGHLPLILTIMGTAAVIALIGRYRKPLLHKTQELARAA